jgi:hypothetical protein
MAKRFGALGPLERLCGQPLLALISANELIAEGNFIIIAQ